MSRPVIFLDFDGVLNSLRSILAFGGCSRLQFDPVAIDLIARLAGAADARVVISSAWRVGNDVPALRAILGEYSTTLAARIIDVTDRDGQQRGEEIARWLATHPHDHNGSFVIIDDDGDMLDGQLSSFVQVRHRDGFGVPEYLKALEIIAPGHADVTQLAWYREDRPLSSEVREASRRLEWEESGSPLDQAAGIAGEGQG